MTLLEKANNRPIKGLSSMIDVAAWAWLEAHPEHCNDWKTVQHNWWNDQPEEWQERLKKYWPFDYKPWED